ncbi:NAD-dependent epimerase [Neomoorella thermoacetica]|uniref:NAD-dependent epimerase n=1 Tax=Neomoorella thermoacetica TaxID=1525 RepID=UPI00084C1401|nr:NAD-dependent epimerase [Moorella thermoacetica]
MLTKGNVLVTGCAGFIGFHVTRRLLSEGLTVAGVDNLNDYYDVTLKKARLEQLQKLPGFSFILTSLEDREAMENVFSSYQPTIVINLAAQAGVRYSLSNPYAYIDSNIVGFLNVLEGCRHHGVEHLIYASSSSVYGANTKMPFSVHDNVDHPVSLYAATKKANELMAHTYSHLYGLPTTGLRFFTVYGPWGRPDMALFIFTKAILEGRPIKVFNYGRMKRDFTYIDDIVEGIVRLLDKKPEPNHSWDSANPDPATSSAPYRLYNIGNNQPVELNRFIAVLEAALGREAQKEYLPLQAGDVPETYADIDDLFVAVGFRPTTTLEEGISKFVAWYKDFYGVK